MLSEPLPKQAGSKTHLACVTFEVITEVTLYRTHGRLIQESDFIVTVDNLHNPNRMFVDKLRQLLPCGYYISCTPRTML